MNGPQIALYRPQIPPNTGNIARLCVGIHSPLNIVGKPAFDWSEKSLKRAGLDHWQNLDFTHYKHFKEFYLKNKKSRNEEKRIICITKEGSEHLWDFKFQETDVLLFGNETQGLPPALLNILPVHLRIPMWGNIRSLNLSNSVSIVAYEYLRQMEKLGNISKESDSIYKRTYYK